MAKLKPMFSLPDELQELLEPSQVTDEETTADSESETPTETLLPGQDVFQDVNVPAEGITMEEAQLREITFQGAVIDQTDELLNITRTFLHDSKKSCRLDADTQKAIESLYAISTRNMAPAMVAPIETAGLESADDFGESLEAALEASFTQTAVNVGKAAVNLILRALKAVMNAIAGIFSRQKRLENTYNSIVAKAAKVSGVPDKEMLPTDGYQICYKNGVFDSDPVTELNNIIPALKTWAGVIENSASTMVNAETSGNGSADAFAVVVTTLLKNIEVPGLTYKQQNHKAESSMVSGNYRFNIVSSQNNSIPSSVNGSDLGQVETGRLPISGMAFQQDNSAPVAPSEDKAVNKAGADACVALAGKIIGMFAEVNTLVEQAQKSCSDTASAFTKLVNKPDSADAQTKFAASYTMNTMTNLVTDVYVPVCSWTYNLARGHLAAAVAAYQNLVPEQASE